VTWSYKTYETFNKVSADLIYLIVFVGTFSSILLPEEACFYIWYGAFLTDVLNLFDCKEIDELYVLVFKFSNTYVIPYFTSSVISSHKTISITSSFWSIISIDLPFFICFILNTFPVIVTILPSKGLLVISRIVIWPPRSA